MLVSLEQQTEQLQRLMMSVQSVAPAVVELMKNELPPRTTSLSTTAIDARVTRALQDCGLVELLNSMQAGHGIAAPAPCVVPEVPQVSAPPSNATPARELHAVHARLTRVPADFDITSMTLERAWEQWRCGDPSGTIGPFRFLQWQDVSSSKKRKRLSHYRCMMVEIQNKVNAVSSWTENPTIEEARTMLALALPELPISGVTPKTANDEKHS